jgi:hypothetical protein
MLEASIADLCRRVVMCWLQQGTRWTHTNFIRSPTRSVGYDYYEDCAVKVKRGLGGDEARGFRPAGRGVRVGRGWRRGRVCFKSQCRRSFTLTGAPLLVLAGKNGVGATRFYLFAMSAPERTTDSSRTWCDVRVVRRAQLVSATL